jgi:hypothetical protein
LTGLFESVSVVVEVVVPMTGRCCLLVCRGRRLANGDGDPGEDFVAAWQQVVCVCEGKDVREQGELRRRKDKPSLGVEPGPLGGVKITVEYQIRLWKTVENRRARVSQVVRVLDEKKNERAAEEEIS